MISIRKIYFVYIAYAVHSELSAHWVKNVIVMKNCTYFWDTIPFLRIWSVNSMISQYDF